MNNALDNIVDRATEEVPELPRLVVADTFLQFNQLGSSLSAAVELWKRIPDATGRSAVDGYLKDIAKYCNAAQLKATRLLEANR